MAEARQETTLDVSPAHASLVERLGYRSACDVLEDRSGRVVRDVPHRTTYATDSGDARVYRKVRTRRGQDAAAEWTALHELARLGVRVPQPVFLARAGDRSAIGMLAVPGRPLSERLASGRLDGSTRRFLVERVAAVVRRLHTAGFVHRDLYWSHWFAERIDEDADEPYLIDVERVFRPRWRRRRWLVKDLAGLVASWPGPHAERALALRFLRAWFGGRLPRDWKRWARAVLRKAARIRRHVPRWGSPPEWACSD